MKRLVVYQSSTGFTEKYAAWIAEALSCEAKELKRVRVQEVQECDSVIFGGWIMGGMISGLDKLQKMKPAKLVVFGVGAMADSDEYRDKLKEQNHLGQNPFFYLEGGLSFEKMRFLPKTMLKMMYKSLVKKPDKTSEEQEMQRAMAGSFDHVDRAKIKPLIACVTGQPEACEAGHMN